MTEDTKPPCCDNCDCFEERDNVQLGEWITIPTCRGKVVSELTPMVTRNNGCLSHPLAREYFNRDVIEELERRIGRFGTYPNNTQAIRVCKEVTELLKEGIPK